MRANRVITIIIKIIMIIIIIDLLHVTIIITRMDSDGDRSPVAW